MSVVFYVSGHGFGHAIRQIEIINALGAAARDRLPLVVRTSAPQWLFTRTVRSQYAFLSGEVDVGVVQIDSLRPDEEETVRRARAFYEQFDRRVEAERSLLRRHQARLVISDVPPLPCAAAAAAGIPAIVCSNFTWDWIYQDYVHGTAKPRFLAIIEDAYAAATAAWRLPMHGGFDTIARIEDVPFVARHARGDLTRDDRRARLNLPLDRQLALVSFGGYGLRELPLERLDCLDAWDVVLTCRDRGDVPRIAGVHAVPEDVLYAQDLRYEDLVAAVDVVITKPGYGILSDCIANATAVLYTPRGRFAEYEVMVRQMPRYLRCRRIDIEAFEAGRWRGPLAALAGSPPPPERPPTDGAEVVARRILDAVSGP